MTQKCAVVPAGAQPWWKNADLEYETCGAPAVGTRAGYPMCLHHMALFDPNPDPLDDDDTWVIIGNEIKKTEDIVDPQERI